VVSDRYMAVDAPRVWLPRSGASRDERFQGVELADQGLRFPADSSSGALPVLEAL
jgi:hypothetical protein